MRFVAADGLQAHVFLLTVDEAEDVVLAVPRATRQSTYAIVAFGCTHT